jgi:hypothetical protein
VEEMCPITSQQMKLSFCGFITIKITLSWRYSSSERQFIEINISVVRFNDGMFWFRNYHQQNNFPTGQMIIAILSNFTGKGQNTEKLQIRVSFSALLAD